MVHQQDTEPVPQRAQAAAQERARESRKIASAEAKAEDKSAKAAEGKPRFDFYKILPGNEEPATDQQLKERSRSATATTAKETFYLQAGAFQNAPDADNLKARLALLGIEASVQTTTAAGQGRLAPRARRALYQRRGTQARAML